MGDPHSSRTEPMVILGPQRIEALEDTCLTSKATVGPLPVMVMVLLHMARIPMLPPPLSGTALAPVMGSTLCPLMVGQCPMGDIMDPPMGDMMKKMLTPVSYTHLTLPTIHSV